MFGDQAPRSGRPIAGSRASIAAASAPVQLGAIRLRAVIRRPPCGSADGGTHTRRLPGEADLIDELARPARLIKDRINPQRFQQCPRLNRAAERPPQRSSVRLAAGSRRSMRAAMVACSGGGHADLSQRPTVRNVGGAVCRAGRRARPVRAPSPRRRTGCRQPFRRSWGPTPPTEESEPKSSLTSAAVSGSLSGARAIALSTGHSAQRAPIFGAVADQHQRVRLRDHRHRSRPTMRFADLVDPVHVLNDDRLPGRGGPARRH